MKIKTEVIKKDKGFESEKNDCTVRALARRIKTSYTRAHQISLEFRDVRHKNRRSKEMLYSVGLEDHPYNASLKRFLDDHKIGCYIVASSGHWFVVDQGKVFDDGRCIGMNTRIVYFA